MGAVANLPFNAVQGRAASSSRLGARALYTLAMLNANPASFQSSESLAAQRAQRRSMIEARRYIGNLLGSLTAPAADARAQSAIVQGLMHVNALSNGNLANMQWGQGCLVTYLNELKTADLVALRGGVLGNPAERDAVLDQMPSSKLRHQASQLLDQIKDALDERSATVFARKSLKQIAKLLPCDPIDGQYLKELLIRLAGDMEAVRTFSPEFDEAHHMNVLIEKLPTMHWHLLTLVQGSKREECLLALNKAGADEAVRARNMLDLICESLLVLQNELIPLRDERMALAA